MTIEERLAQEFELQSWQVSRATALLDEGNTIPFIARYRKDETGQLDDQILRAFEGRLAALRNLEEKRADMLRLVAEQGALTDAFAEAVAAAESLTVLEDLYRPYRPKRKTRASDALARGLAPLADAMVAEGADLAVVDALAAQLAEASEELADAEAAYAGASDILAERLSDDAEVRQALRNYISRHGVLYTAPGETPDPLYEMYEDYKEALAAMPPHRLLAVNRAEKANALKVQVEMDEGRIVEVLHHRLCRRQGPFAARLHATAEDSWKRLLKPSLIKEVRRVFSEAAEDASIGLFRENLRELLLQPPVSGHVVLGFDPGYRNGCKLAVVNPTGAVLATAVIHPFQGEKGEARAEKAFLELMRKHAVTLVGIGNGTASRESERFVARLIEAEGLSAAWIIVSEAGASVYSASPLAAEEFPEMDVALRSAVSIARRVQDPLAELVKIDPRSIGVGQYQHDLNQKKLAAALDAVVEDCVNHVGVDANTASAPLLNRVAGISSSVAKQIVRHREENGSFNSRKDLLKVAKLGPKAFEQSAGFLRIRDGVEPLDNTSVHPESYDRVRRLSASYGLPPSPQLAEQAAAEDLAALSKRLDVGPATLKDILDALRKPGRDPREAFSPPPLRHDLLDIKDLKPDMVLDGVVRNVAAFGAFVDIGLHDDGLVHVSELSDRFVKDPLTVVHVGQNVQVRVLSVDVKRNRIALSMKGLGAARQAAR